jgi:glycosyltransferase involved in cell wall biosynthesis
MRIVVNALFTVPSVHSGAVQTVTGALLSHLSKASSGMGAKLFILVSRTNVEYWQHLCPEAEFVLVPFSTRNQAARIALEQVACNWAVRKTKADVFYSSSGALPFTSLPCKTVVYFQNILFFHFDEFYSRSKLGLSRTKWLLSQKAQDLYSQRVLLNSMKCADEVIANSRTMAIEAERYTGIHRPMHIVPLGVHKGFGPHNSQARPVSEAYVLMVSSLVPHKNYEAAVEIFANLKRRYQIPQVLVIIGTGPTGYVQSLKNLAATLKIEASVRFVGQVQHEHLPAWYEHADAFMLTSACESFGLPILEAMAAGVPVLASKLSGVPETVGSAGIMEDPAATDKFADQLYGVLTDHELRQRLRSLGLKRAAEFTWSRTADATLNIMKVLVSRNA